MLSSASHGFAVEFPGEYEHYEEFDEYLREEFPRLHPGWEPRFGRVTSVDPSENDLDYKFLLTGNVPDATSEDDAEDRLHRLLDEVRAEFKSLKPHLDHLPAPVARVWRWKDRSGSAG